ncbi:MAG: inositol monophosphatase family protein, partial [Acidimicrobiales bacterium]
MDAGGVLDVLYGAADAVARALEQLQDWGPAGTRAGQYRSDLVADEAAIAILDGAGMGVLSEESGVQRDDRELLVVLDPLDGSTNASRRIPWYATSLCALDSDGPWVAVVVNQANHTRFDAVRGGGARRNGIPISPSSADRLSDSIIGLSGYPDQHMGWRQYRALGAAALDLCAVAEGVLDGFVDC